MDKRKQAEVTPGLAASPLPQVEVNSTPAPGLKGPKGLSPRQNFSRVNSGSPPMPEAGSVAQKSAPPMGATMLPAKVASEGSMGSIAATPTLQDMVKAAMAGAQSRARLSAEAAIQQANLGEKVASEKCAECGGDHLTSEHKEKKAAAGDVSTEYVEKLAAALEFAAPFVKSAAHLGGPYTLKAETQAVGKGPGALHVMEAEASKPLPDHKGQAHTQIPTSTPLQQAVAGAKTQLENNEAHPAGGKEKMIQRNVGKTASVLAKIAKEDEKLEKQESEGMAEVAKGLAKAEEAHGKEDKGEKKEGSAPQLSMVDYMMSLTKKAEDAINPAQISAGAAVPPDTSAAGEQGGTPAGGMPQGPRGLIGSNEAAINYNKNEAKSPVKTDMKKYVDEPALSGSTDSVLSAAFEHSSAKDNNKMASAQAVTKTAAARALLSKLAEAAQSKVG